MKETIKVIKDSGYSETEIETLLEGFKKSQLRTPAGKRVETKQDAYLLRDHLDEGNIIKVLGKEFSIAKEDKQSGSGDTIEPDNPTEQNKVNEDSATDPEADIKPEGE